VHHPQIERFQARVESPVTRSSVEIREVGQSLDKLRKRLGYGTNGAYNQAGEYLAEFKGEKTGLTRPSSSTDKLPTQVARLSSVPPTFLCFADEGDRHPAWRNVCLWHLADKRAQSA